MQLETQRLLLREFKEDDWREVLEYQRDPRYLRYYPWTERSPEDVQRFIHLFLDYQEQHLRCKFQLAIVVKSSGKLIGNCGIRMPSEGAQEADMGYEISPEHWGQGYATEAAEAILRFGFEVLKVHRVWAWCVAENTASARVLEKLGMTHEGRLREKEYFRGRWWDSLIYAILEQEWRAHQ